MNKNYYIAHVDNLPSLRPAFGQVASDVLKKQRSCVINRMMSCTVHFWLANPMDEFVFYDSKGNRMLASAAFADIYIAGYRRALSDVAQDISYELNARSTWAL